MAKIFVYTVRLRGCFNFPHDMLRYDQCYPKSETDSNAIARTWAMGGSDQDEVIEVKRVTSNARWEPTKGRWEAYNWKVIGVERSELDRSLF